MEQKEKEFELSSETYAILAVLRNNPDYTEALRKRGEDLMSDKRKLYAMSERYTGTNQYQVEIDEGTQKYQKLLSDGKVEGHEGGNTLSGSFVPTKYTPLLNFLFFSQRDEDIPVETPEETMTKLVQQYVDMGFEKSTLVDLYIKGLVHQLPDGYDSKTIEFDDVITDDVSIMPDEMEKFIYGNMTHTEFKKLKKLKALSMSSNAHEALLAHSKCVLLCKKYGLEFEKIPCNIEKKD